MVGVLFDPVMIDKALQQTLEAGLIYAIAPAQCWSEWIRFCLVEPLKVRFQWWRTCGLPGWDFANSLVDDEGNLYWCMKDPDHQGDHGFRVEGLQGAVL